MKTIAQVLDLGFAQMLAIRFDGWVDTQIINGTQLFVVII